MCPDRELLSAYTDGEVPSPWKERIAEHLASCPSCAALVGGYAALGERLRAESCPDEAAIVGRGRARLDSLLAARPAAASWEPRPLAPRRLSLSLPLATAAALLLLLLGGAATAGLLSSARGRAPALASAEVSPNGAIPVSMDDILRYLDDQNAQVTLTINLPTGATFAEPGDPVIMRAPRTNQGAAARPASAPPAKLPGAVTPADPGKGGAP